MQGGVIGGICLLAFLLSKGRAEELESIKEPKVIQDVEAVGLRKNGDYEAPGDLKNELSLAVPQSNFQVNEGRSGDVSQTDARSFEDSAVSNAFAQSNGDGSASAYSVSSGGSAQSRASAIAGGAPASPFNPFNEDLGPYIPPGSNFAQAEAQAIKSDSQGLNSYSYPSSYPYSPGSSSVQEQVDNGLYQPPLNFNQQADSGLYKRDPVYNPYGQGLSSSQAQNLIDNGLHQPGYNGLSNVNPYNQGSSFPQMPGHGDSESKHHIIEPNSMQTKPVPGLDPVSDSLAAFSSSYPYSPGLSSGFAQDNSGPYQPVPVPDPNFSPYERFLVPYKDPNLHSGSEAYQPVPITSSKENRYESNLTPSSQGLKPNGFALSHLFSQNEPYQAVPLPDSNPSPYNSFLVPYKGPNPLQTETDIEEYQPILIPKNTTKQQEAISRLHSESTYSIADFPSSHSYGFKHNSIQIQSPDDRGSYQAIPITNSGLYDPNMIPNIESRFSQKQIDNGAYQPVSIQNNVLRMKPYQSIPVLETDSHYESSVIKYREQNTEKNRLSEEINAYEYRLIPNNQTSDTLSSGSTDNVARSREYNHVTDDIDSNANDFISKSGWDPYEYNPYPPSGPYPKLYPSGAEAVQVNPDNKPAASGVVKLYNQGLSSYASDYPSESPYRPGGYNPMENEAQKSPNVFASAQSSPIAFQDAKSRAVLPHEYVFPNKMPGGENVIQCTKENEFHHFWSKELDCLVCICLNEYGLLQPVCASCGGCHNPPPKLPEPVPRLPESIPVQPATPGPFEPIPLMPEPYPPALQPEPSPEAPIQEPVPTSEPYPVYPEPVPVTFPEPVPTLPPPSSQAHCNPLPTGVPFTNPLHPCQICICRESYMTGKTDVQIECKENPQCIAPADVTTLPPLPDVSVPIPLPICEKFPENVLFPHPTETCKLCKCAKSLSEDGVPEQQITCYPHPDCVPKMEAATEPVPPLPIPVDPYQVKPYPEPEPVPIEPLREPYHLMEPVPLPEVVTVEPLPWPPITTIAPVSTLPVTPRPGPLPGPSPHESCRPYPPNQTFQHPWDECQVCLCTEAFAVGMITVEVNCYTKPSCCIDPPDSVKTALPGKLLPFKGFSAPYLGPSNAVNSPDIPALSSGSQPITSTFRPSPPYPSYNPSSVKMYPGSNQAAADPLTQPPVYSGYVDPSSSYPYQPNYPTSYVNPQYPEYPPRLPALPGTGNTIGQYKPNNFGYPGNYPYVQGDAVGNNYPPQGHFQPFDPRFQTVPAPSYPGMYQRAYERPHMYAPPPLRDGYVKPLVTAPVGTNVQNLATSYAGPIGYSGKDGPDVDDSQ